MPRDDPLERTIDGYDALADHPDEIPWGTGDYQRHYVRPVVRPLIPDVAGARVLDAGCGLGDYVDLFLEESADVVGVDASADALARARDRFGDRATFRRTDLTTGLDVANDGAFDLVFCNLVLDHLADWGPVLAEFRRVLAPDGRFVFTTIHPMRRYDRYRDQLSSYHETEGYERRWGAPDAEITSYHRPMEEIVGSLVDSGFAIETFEEAQPPPAYEGYEPDRYEHASTEPDLLCVRAMPRQRTDAGR